ncbi:hypothetical protein B0T20DRAFT_268565 [Sordaria brevicollis]|uniref:RING-type domain-containing protein n=1 Tax=Sordaria brevicollis TaxID=83679 RepID=A0AAE0U9W7_SORBR|nr:hypothetical protein B0T20DRAFT_268565 [Sordaria brevicollis]
MVFINPAILEGARAVARQVSETGTSILTSAVVSATASATASATSSAISTSSALLTASPSTVSPTAVPDPTQPSSGNEQKEEKGGQSPLLFFVALGFGVVFTNLWIIVGVKYCFRYNARTRQMRMAEEGDQINMEAMPRPHRRRREKKLMTIDEVNEKFPMLKYKTWVASRARDGLPTSGGVSAPSRPNSIRDADAISRELPNKERMSTEGRPTTSTVEPVDRDSKNPQHHETKESTSSTVPLAHAVTDETTPPKDARVSHDEGEEEEDPIDAALPPECEGTSGDTCAICIDTLEDDDDVRGLTCGHAFHAACLDPWLTSRRACCPLCKADYYTPKPRPDGQPVEGQPGVIHVTLSNDPRNNRMNLPNRPRHAFFGLSRPPRTVYVVSNNDQRGSRRRHGERSERRRDNGSANQQPTSSAQAPSNRGIGDIFSDLRATFPTFRRNNNGAQNTDANANPPVTASNLEAGVRPAEN